jgi:hypothetical protein
MTDRDDLERRSEELHETPLGDHAIAAGLAGLNAIPVLGGVIATFVSEYVPRQKQRRLVSFVQDLAEKLREEEDRIDREFVKSEEFAGLVEDVIDSAQQRRNVEKHRYYASLVAGSATHARPTEEERDRLLDALDRLRLPHLRLLHVIATTTEPPPGMWAGGVSHVVQSKMEISDADLREQWGDLAAANIADSYPSGTMTAAGAGNLAVRLTPFGRRFVDFLHVGAPEA